MKEEANGFSCGREKDLIAFLYGELNDLESRTFQLHMDDCATCNLELDAFKHVRDSVVAWRDKSLGGAVSREEISATRPTSISRRRPSASAALREFFTLSPMWMKGALAFASLLFFLVAGLALTHWRNAPPAALLTDAKDAASSERKLNALVEQRVQDELRRIKIGAETMSTPAALPVDNTTRRNPSRVIKRGSQLANNVTEQKARRPLSSLERAQLASDLRLVTQGNESELYLLDDGINK